MQVYVAVVKPKQSEPRRCVKVEVAVLGSPSLIVLMVSVDIKQQLKKTKNKTKNKKKNSYL